MSFCSNCGKEIVENVKFCSACGKEIISASVEVGSSSGDKQEKAFFKCEGIGKELIISSELIKCSYNTLTGVKKVSIIPRNINSFEYRSNVIYRIPGTIMILVSFVPLFTLIGSLIGYQSLTDNGILFCILFFSISFVIGLCCLLVKPQIEIFSGATKYLLPINIFGSKAELLNAIQSVVSYQK